MRLLILVAFFFAVCVLAAFAVSAVNLSILAFKSLTEDCDSTQVLNSLFPLPMLLGSPLTLLVLINSSFWSSIAVLQRCFSGTVEGEQRQHQGQNAT